MKFMVITRIKDAFYALPPEKRKELGDAGAQFVEKWTKEGKLKEMYYLGDMKGTMAIVDLKSAEDLARSTESPLFPFVDREITPLVEMDVARKAQAKK